MMVHATTLSTIPLKVMATCPLPPALDESRLETLLNAIGDKLPPIVAIYLDDCSGNLDKLDDLIQQGEMEEVRKLAHQMKGASLTLGLLELQDLFRNLEQAAKVTPASCRQWHTETLAAFQRARSAMWDRFPTTAKRTPS